MAIPLTGAGSLGVRFGHIFGRILDILKPAGSAVSGPNNTTSIITGLTTIDTDLGNGTALPKTRQKDSPFLLLSSYQSAAASAAGILATLCQDELKAMVNIDLGAPTLEDTPITLAAAVQYLVTQMTGSTISAPTSTVQNATVAAGAQTSVNTPAGTPVIVMSTKNGQGLIRQLIFPETLYFTCTKDAGTGTSGGATGGRESIQVVGYPAIAGTLTAPYPGGSGCNKTLTLVDGTGNNTGGNILQNSDFPTFTTTNQADNWTYAVGVATTNWLNGTSSNAYTTGGGSLELLGDGATASSATQAFNTTPAAGVGAGGTSYVLLPGTQYAFSVWLKTPVVPAAGVLHFDLIDGAGNILNDDNGVANTITADLTAGGLNTTSYVNVTGTFRTPKNLLTQTAPFKLRILNSTALSNTRICYFGRMAMTPMVDLYAGGPQCAIFSSNVKPVAGPVPDQWTVAMTNNFTTSGTGLFHFMFDRVFGLKALGLQLPYGAGTIADSLIA